MALGDVEALSDGSVQVKEARSALGTYTSAAEFAQGGYTVGASAVINTSGTEGGCGHVAKPAVHCAD